MNFPTDQHIKGYEIKGRVDSGRCHQNAAGMSGSGAGA